MWTEDMGCCCRSKVSLCVMIFYYSTVRMCYLSYFSGKPLGLAHIAGEKYQVYICDAGVSKSAKPTNRKSHQERRLAIEGSGQFFHGEPQLLSSQ